MRTMRHTIMGACAVVAVTLGYAALLRWAPPHAVQVSQNSQDALWALPNALGAWWWGIAAFFATMGALTMFLYMFMNQPFSGLLMSRIILMAAMVCFALTPLNSGWLPWGVMLASIGGFYASFLIATDWCNRQNKWHDLWAALTWRKQGRDGNRQGRLLG